MSKKKTKSGNSNPRLITSKSQAFSCLLCGKCCETWDVPLSKAEKDRVEALKIPEIDFSKQSYFTAYKKSGFYLINKVNGKCIFEGNDNLCVIHQFAGEEAKPLACRLYPFDIYSWKGNVATASLRFDCPAVAKNHGCGITDRHAEILTLSHEMTPRNQEMTTLYAGKINPGLKILRLLNDAYQNFLLAERFSPTVRLYAGTRLVEFYSDPENQSDFWKAGSSLRDDAYQIVERSVETLDLIIQNSSEPKLDNRVTFRYLLSGYARVDEETIGGFPMLGRIKRARTIVKFTLGKGSLRDLGDLYPDTTGIDPLGILSDLSFPDAALKPYWRFLESKLSTMHYFGEACLKLTFEEGLLHLLFSFPAVLAFAGLYAAADGRKILEEEDVQEALMIVDHTFARSPFFQLNHVKKMIRKLTSTYVFPSFLKFFHANPQ